MREVKWKKKCIIKNQNTLTDYYLSLTLSWNLEWYEIWREKNFQMKNNEIDEWVSNAFRVDWLKCRANTSKSSLHVSTLNLLITYQKLLLLHSLLEFN